MRIRFAAELVEAHRDGLTKVHGRILVSGRNVKKGVAVGEVIVGKTRFFVSKKQSNIAGLELAMDLIASFG